MPRGEASQLHFCLEQVKSVPEDSESAEALRAVAEDITGENIVVMSVDLITDVRLEVSSNDPSCALLPSICYVGTSAPSASGLELISEL